MPTVVVSADAIGGFLHSGIVGLFLGSVIRALGYELFLAWLYPEAPIGGDAAK